MKRFEFICGSIEVPPVKQDVVRKTMDIQGKRTVNLRIADISRAMVSNVPDLLLDLLEIAAYVYCGDQRAQRGGEKLRNAGTDWRRDLLFVIPVRCLDVWSSAELRQELEATLGFLSDDAYEFEFIAAEAPLAEAALYFSELSEGAFDADEIALFSGGLDSFAGATDSIVCEGRRTVLVGHHSAGKVLAVQKALISHFVQAGYASRLMHIPVNVTNTGVDPTESTQRSRSFLFASLAFVIARMLGKNGLTFYENGVVSLNLPIAKDVLGARATRTTHPQVMRGFERIFSLLAGSKFTISTPYLWLTKKEVVDKIVAAGFGASLSRAASCVHPMGWTTEVRHCGVCSQCIDRRFAVLASGAEALDPAEGYAVDLLTGARVADEDIRMAVAYVKFCRDISASDQDRFKRDHPDIYTVVHHVPDMAADDVLEQAWAMIRRHADGVNGVLEAGAKVHSQAMVHDRLPRGAILRLCVSRDRIEAPLVPDCCDDVAASLDRLDAPVCDFAVDKAAGRIWFRGGFYVDGAYYRLIEALLPNHREAKAECKDVPYFYSPDLADHLEMLEPTLRARVTKLRGLVEERLAVDQGIVFPNGFIENQYGKGYRLPPELREVARADLGTHSAGA
ncbi:7-cyano-7-deazaguanine synthase [Mesorhizobium sp. KR9-304]|uniref:7-cyano-7-deazaguanine synthase n=1 Tax=Mesorhizobium sp. KR9-304 TaxID=3156614 RepID=UPI0032B42014